MGKKKTIVKLPETGDEVIVKTKSGVEKGILLKSHEPGVVLLKLGSGYNIGIKNRDAEYIQLVKKAKESEDEEKIKMKGKPRVDLIITGGTISASLDSKTGGVKWLTSPSKFLSFYPEIREIADVRIINPFMKASESMNSLDWIKIAKIVAKSLNDPHVQGVIITHGTDFLHYTSAALSFMLGKVNKPVVLTYSQRSVDRGSSDARLNLVCAAHAALSDIAEVMLVGHASLNDDYCFALRGSKVRKMHTSRRDTFRPVNCKPLAKIWQDGKIEKIVECSKRNKNKVKVDAVFSDKVALLKFYPGQSPDILEYYSKKGYKGIIIEMSGLGHVCTEGKLDWNFELKSLCERGIVVCGACQTIYGRLNPLVYSPGREILKSGVVYLKDMLPETGLIKLGWLLGHKEKGIEVVREEMQKNLVGEINERLGSEFLE